MDNKDGQMDRRKGLKDKRGRVSFSSSFTDPPGQAYFLALPWAATASMAFFTVSASPRKAMGLTGFRLASSSYTIGIPVGRFSSMIAASDIPGKITGTQTRQINKQSSRQNRGNVIDRI